MTRAAMGILPDPPNYAFIEPANVASEDCLAGDGSTAPTEAAGNTTRHLYGA